MERYLHRVVGLYPTTDSAALARDELLTQGLPPDRIRILTPGPAASGTDTDAGVTHQAPDARSDSDDVLKDLLRDGAIGTAVGTAAGAGISLAMAAANITLFIASPVLGALYLVGWGASLGGLAGAVVGAERSHGDVPGLIRDALAAGQVVLVVHAATEDQTTLARQVLGTTMADAGPVPAPA